MTTQTKRLILIVFALAVVALWPQAAAAQTANCGTGTCANCFGPFAKWPPYEGNDKWSKCSPGQCEDCPAVLTSDQPPAEKEILEAITASDPSELHEVVAAHGHMLLLHSDRNLVAVRGSACDPAAVTSVLFVAPEKTRALRALGLEDLREFLETQLAES